MNEDSKEMGSLQSMIIRFFVRGLRVSFDNVSSD